MIFAHINKDLSDQDKIFSIENILFLESDVKEIDYVNNKSHTARNIRQTGG